MLSGFRGIRNKIFVRYANMSRKLSALHSVSAESAPFNDIRIYSMEQMLLKMARQLDALDEASLMGLWEKYMQIVSRFEPSQRWQEAVLVLSLIQAKHWKNQLFNVQWSERLRNARSNISAGGNEELPFPPDAMPFSLETPAKSGGHHEKRAKVLSFSQEKTPEV